MRSYSSLFILSALMASAPAGAARRCPPDLAAVVRARVPAPEPSPASVVQASGGRQRLRLVMEDGTVQMGWVSGFGAQKWNISSTESRDFRPRLDFNLVEPSQVVRAEVYTGSITFTYGTSRSFTGDNRWIRFRRGGREVLAEVLDVDSRSRRARARVLLIGADGVPTLRTLELDAPTLRGSQVDVSVRKRIGAAGERAWVQTPRSTPAPSPAEVVQAAGGAQRLRLVLDDGTVHVGWVQVEGSQDWAIYSTKPNNRGHVMEARWLRPSQVRRAEVYTGSITFPDGTSRSFAGDDRYIRFQMRGREVFAEVFDVDSRSRRARAYVAILDANGVAVYRNMELDAATLRRSVRADSPAHAPPSTNGSATVPETRPRLVVSDEAPPVRDRVTTTGSLLGAGGRWGGTLDAARQLVARLPEQGANSPATELYEWVREGSNERISHPELYQTPEGVARAMGLEFEPSGGDLIVGGLAGAKFFYASWSGWFRTELNPDRLPPGADRPKVYLTVPVDRMREFLPSIIERARQLGAHQLKFGQDLENLIRDDRLVLHFSTDAEALAFSASMSAELAARGITGRPPPFTHRVGSGPVGFGYDTRGTSWRAWVSDEVARAIASCGSGSGANDCMVTRLRAVGIDPRTWLPVGRVDSVRELLSPARPTGR